MASQLALVLTVAMAISVCTGSFITDYYCSRKVIGADLPSLPCIIDGMCKNKDNATIAEAFFACYDDVPNKEIFFKCQVDNLGGLLNTTETISRGCEFVHKFDVFPYMVCLSTNFKEANANLTASVELVNVCQAKVYGLKTA